MTTLAEADAQDATLGNESLRDFAREFDDTVRDYVTIYWTLRENVRAPLCRLVRRILRKHGYPPDKQEQATRTVLEQAEALSQTWATTKLPPTPPVRGEPTQSPRRAVSNHHPTAPKPPR